MLQRYKNNHRSNILTDQVQTHRTRVIGSSKIHVLWVGKVILGEIEFISLGRKDGVHRQEEGSQ